MSDLNALAQKVASHLAGRPVTLRWRDPVSASAVGQVYKSKTGEVVIDVSDSLTSIETKYRVMLHECAHVAIDYGWLPVTSDHQRPSRSLTKTQKARDKWRANPHELAAQNLATKWEKFAEANAHKHWRAGRSSLECKLLALLDWRK